MELLRKKTSCDLNLPQKWSILYWSMQHYDHVKGRIIDGGMSKIVSRFSVAERTIRNIFEEYSESLAKGEIFSDLTPSSKKVCGV